MQVFTLHRPSTVPGETEKESKMQYSLLEENKDGGIYQEIFLKIQRQRQYCNILYLERTKMDVFTLEHLPEETELETKMKYFLPGENKDGGIYTKAST